VVKVHPKMLPEPIEVDDDEAASMERMGLLKPVEAAKPDAKTDSKEIAK
jgi:hypothetical protein